jgi:hypothetical protein
MKHSLTLIAITAAAILCACASAPSAESADQCAVRHQLVSETWYDASERVIHRAEYAYDGEGNRLAGDYTVYFHGDSDEPIGEYRYIARHEYRNGRIGRISWTVVAEGAEIPAWEEIFHYDAAGRPAEEIKYSYGPSGKSVGSTTTYSYDDHGLLYEIIILTKGPPDRLERTVYARDAGGSPLSSETEISSGGVVLIRKYSSYEGGKLVDSRTEGLAVDDVDEVSSYGYDDHGRLAQIVSHGWYDTRTAFSYDAYGNLVEERYYESPRNGREVLVTRKVFSYEALRS